MSNHVEQCAAEAEAAGWTGEALQRLVIDPKSSTPAGFKAVLKEANEIRGLIKFGGPAIRGAGQDTEGAAEFFVSQGHSLSRVRTDTINLMAEHDADTHVDTTPYRAKTGNVYAARSAEIDAHKKGTPHA